MRKTIGNIALIAICIYFFAVITISAEAAEPEPLKVGLNQTYPTLTSAIESAQEGQVIQIEGDVTETNPANPVVIDKRVTIQGDGSSVYRITGWTKPASPFQITAEGVMIKNLMIDINGGATTYPLIETGKNLSLNNVSITLSGTSEKASAPISVEASGLKMKNVDITNTARATKIIDLQGNGASFQGVSITAGASITGIYSETSPDELILEDCTFYTTAGTAKAVSLPSPAGFTLKGCSFSFAGAGTGSGNLGLLFTTPSDVTANETLIASDCTFNMKSGTGISLNGYSASLTDCEFNFDAISGKGINSEMPSDAALTFAGCKFYVGKTAGAKITGANCVVLKGNTGDIKIDQCTVVASDPSIGLTTPNAIIINAPDSELNSLTISNSDFAFQEGANSAIGVNAKAIERLVITDSDFIVDAPSVKCIHAETIGTGHISKSNFAVGTTSTAANAVVCINVINAESFMIEDASNFSINTKSTGFVAGVKNLIVKDSGFYIDAGAAKGIVVNNVEAGSIVNCKFDIKKAGAIGLGILDSADIHFAGNMFDLSTGGKGINMTSSSGNASGNVVIEHGAITIQGDATIVGFLFEYLNSLKIENTTLKTPSGTTSSITCIRGNHIKAFELDHVDMTFDSTTVNGIIINETNPPLGSEVKVTITNTTVNLKEKSSRAIRLFNANGVLVDHYGGKIEAAATNSYLLMLKNSKNVEVRNCEYEAEAVGAKFLSFESGSTTSEDSSNFKIHHNRLKIKDKAQGIIAIQANHNVEIYENIIHLMNATKGVVIAYGRNNNVYGNQFFGENCEMAIVSDGVDEIASFTPDVDQDIYDDNGSIIDAYRNKFHNNKFTGSYERGLYISNNGDVVRDNDFSNATFHYESEPGKSINTQIIVVYCKDVKILNNSFAKARSSDNQVIRINNAIISEATGNITQLTDGASDVLFVQGTISLAPNKLKYPESITVHNDTNTINGLTPIEIMNEWNDPDNLIYEYILEIPESLPPTPTEPEPLSPQPKTYDYTPNWNDAYVEINENEVPLSPAPEINPNPQTGKRTALFLHVMWLSSLVIAGLLFWLSPISIGANNRKQGTK